MDANKETLLKVATIQDKLDAIQAFMRENQTVAVVFENAGWGTVAELAFVDSKLAEILDFLNNEQE